MKLSSLSLLALVAQSTLAHARLLGRGGGNGGGGQGGGQGWGGGQGGGGQGGGQGGGGQGGGGQGGGGQWGGGQGGGGQGGGGQGEGGQGGGGQGGGGQVGALDEAEARELIFMREEEKMARDVYLTMLEEHGSDVTPVFANIAKSEQRHMDRMLDMINLYGLTDPVLSNEVGSLQDPTLAALYPTLIEQGEVSLLEGLRVGTLIEETDILDLREAIGMTDETQLIRVYDNLLSASYNHLNGFVGAIEAQGGSYTPALLDQDDVDAILGN